MPSNDRSFLLRRIRTLLSTEGYEISSARPGIVEIRVFRKVPVRDLSGADAVSQLETDERAADRNDHWWLHDVVWSASGNRHVLAGVDPDGNDLSFVAWGDSMVQETMQRLEDLILNHRPG